MRPRTLRLVVFALTLASPALGRADSRQSGLQVGVTVTRQCSVSTGSNIDVTCTRASSSVIQTSQDGRGAQATPLVTTGPGVTSASVPLSSNTTVVTIQF